MMRGLILAAGRGSRLGNMTESLPKGMIQLGEYSLLEWQIRAMKAAGIQEIAIIKGYRAEDIQFPNLNYFINPRWESTNMVASLVCAREWLETTPCLISYADILYEPQIVNALIQTSAPLVLPYFTQWKKVWEARFETPLSDLETFQLDSASQLKEIGHKPQSFTEIEGQFMGLLKTEPLGWQSLKQIYDALQNPKLDLTGLLQKAIAAGQKIPCIPYNGFWLEIDNQTDYQVFKGWFESGLIAPHW